MPEELGRIEKPTVEGLKPGRKLFFVPLILPGQEMPSEFKVIYNRYWDQVDAQINSLESKLGPAKHIFHELIPESGEEGLKTLEEMKINSLLIVKNRIEKGAAFEAIEDKELLSELMDWSRCLSLGLQSQKAFSQIYKFYNEAIKTRDEALSKKVNELLKDDESAVLIMAEGHHVKIPDDVSTFYIAPPALDELKRWMRDNKAKQEETPSEETENTTET
jgi:hypothetical protein